MTDNDIIALQTKAIYDLVDKNKKHKADKLKIHYLIFGIGAPLNDNRLQYNLDQLKTFSAIANCLDDYEDEES